MELESIKVSKYTKTFLVELKEAHELSSLDHAVRFVMQVYVEAKQAGILVITGGSPLISIHRDG